MKDYVDSDKLKSFASKTQAVKDLVNMALDILDAFGVPLNLSPRRLERMALAFLAVGGVKQSEDWQTLKDLNHGTALKTREIISFINTWFEERISPGSYDDIRRKDLKLLTLAEIVLPSSPKSATNDSTRGYVINPVYAELIRQYGMPNWRDLVSEKLGGIQSLASRLKRERELVKLSVTLPSGGQLALSLGEHNELQKAIVEEFLPRYGYGAQVLYLGDSADKYLYLDRNKLEALSFFELSHEELPDVVAYSETKNWLYLIEAVHSSGAISELRLLQLQKLCAHCKAEIIYVSAFQSRLKFRQFIADIAWETEVWIAEAPDHLVHFNGDKFLGPYQPPQ